MLRSLIANEVRKVIYMCAMPSKLLSYPALILTQNDRRFFFSTIPVEDLFPWCFVARRNEDPMQGFQRTLSESRADDIARYLAIGTGSIPTNVVLSAQNVANLQYNSRSKTISFSRADRGFLVLDGQHRLWGYSKSAVKHRVPVAIYQGLTRAEEAKLFIDINTNQRGVPAALLLDIKELAAIESAKEGLLRTFFDRLQRDSNSALNGRLSAASAAPGKLSRVAFNRALDGALDSDLVRPLKADDMYLLIRNYVNAFDAEIQNKALLVRASYFEAIFDIFDEALRMTMDRFGDLKQKSIQEIVRKIAVLEFEGQSNLTRKAYVKLMQAALRKGVAVTAAMLS